MPKLANHSARICTLEPVLGSCLIVQPMTANYFLDLWMILEQIAKKLDTPRSQLTPHAMLSLILGLKMDAT